MIRDGDTTLVVIGFILGILFSVILFIAFTMNGSLEVCNELDDEYICNKFYVRIVSDEYKVKQAIE